MKSFIRSFLAAILVVGLSATLAYGKEPCQSQVIQAWVGEREEAAIKVIKTWLKQTDPDLLHQAGFELLRLEVLLLPCIPPLKIEDFYLLALDRPDPDLVPLAVLQAYLRKHGVPLDAKGFFLGKEFFLKVKAP